MKVSTHFKCHCGNIQKVFFLRPGFMKPTVCGITCTLCESLWNVRFSRPKLHERKQPNALHVETQLLKASPELAALLKEEADAKAQEQAG